MVEKLLLACVATFWFALVILVIAAVLAFPIMWLVNYLFTPTLLSAIFGTAQIDFWQALCLSLLCASLFKSRSA